jgi:hypothetical protein
LLQEIVRPADLTPHHLNALGVFIHPAARLTDLIPDPECIPPFGHWEAVSLEEAHTINESARRPRNDGGLSPGAILFRDRRTELSVDNEAAFRAVRRLAPPAGKSQVRLGNSFEFFRNLESLAGFWDDTSQPVTARLAEDGKSKDADSDKAESDAQKETADAKRDDNRPPPDDRQFFRTASGSAMPAEYRHSILASFLKLVTYDFGCSIGAPRVEPRLNLNAPSVPIDEHMSEDAGVPVKTKRRKRYASSFGCGCAFIYHTPTVRLDAKNGIVEGPIAAVSARHTTNFPPQSSEGDRDSLLDFSRELVAAVLTAQHRRRQGRKERRIGEGAWWTTKARWGGGPGGPIGREVDLISGQDVIGDKDEIPSSSPSGSRGDASPASKTVQAISNAMGDAVSPRTSATSGPRSYASAAASPPSPSRNSKKGRKNLAIYDSYRLVRPPSSTWDAKTRYMALGRPPGVGCDDVFVVSCLFHHVCLLRVRVPDAFGDVLDGTEEDDGEERKWGKLEVWRSPWFDLFKPEERIEGMKYIWAMMAYSTRVVDDGSVALKDKAKEEMAAQTAAGKLIKKRKSGEYGRVSREIKMRDLAS